MPGTSEAQTAAQYRARRKAFIAACEKAGADAISRVHPAKGPDGKPLFCDSAAFGPRDAARAVLLVSADADGAAAALLKDGVAPPAGTRLVLVHALDPFTAAWGEAGGPPDWPARTLAAIATEDLKRVQTLTVLAIGVDARTALAAALPGAAIAWQAVAAGDAAEAIRAALKTPDR